MIYVALLRGINVGGNSKVEMPRLKAVFEKLGYKNVKTHINSGNVIFSTGEQSTTKLAEHIEGSIEKEFTLPVSVMVRDLPNITALNKSILSTWVNDTEQKTDVIFLWSDIDSPDILNQISIKPDIETVKYVHGALVWNIARKNTTPGSAIKLVQSKIYKKMTVRNINTVRKLLALMQEVIE